MSIESLLAELLEDKKYGRVSVGPFQQILTVYIGMDLNKALKDKIAALGITKSDYIRILLQHHLGASNEKKPNV